MIPDYDQLQQRADDGALHYLMREKAEAAINTLGAFTPPRIQPDDIHIYGEPSASPGIRSWLVSIRHGDRFVVSVTLELATMQWRTHIHHWEVSPVPGVYYMKQHVSAQSPAPQVIEEVFNNGQIKGEPVGSAEYVGQTVEANSRPVYWLYTREQPSTEVKRRISGSYILRERRFELLTASTPWQERAAKRRRKP